MPTLSSAQNPALKEIRKAVARGSLTGNGRCVAESFHLLEEALASDCEIDSVFTTESAQTAVESRIRGRKQVRVIVLADDLFRGIAATEHSQGVLALVQPPHWTLDQLFPSHAIVLILDGIQDPGNAGTILRAAEAFGATGVAFLKGTVNPSNPKAIRASAGSVFRVPLVTSIDERSLLNAVRQHETELFAMMPQGGLPVTEARLERSCAIVIGGEARGVGEQLFAHAAPLQIPTVAVESLNAAMAATVVLYEARKQRMGNFHELV